MTERERVTKAVELQETMDQIMIKVNNGASKYEINDDLIKYSKEVMIALTD
jgi:hypothetical protein